MYTSVATPASPAQHHAMATTAVRHVPLGTAGTASCVCAALAEKTMAAMTHQAVSSPPARNSNQEPRPHASQVMHCGMEAGGWQDGGEGRCGQRVRSCRWSVTPYTRHAERMHESSFTTRQRRCELAAAGDQPVGQQIAWAGRSATTRSADGQVPSAHGAVPQRHHARMRSMAMWVSALPLTRNSDSTSEASSEMPHTA